MCFAPQRRALFRQLRNVLRATTACNFSSLIWPDGSAPAALESLLFRPSGATNHWKKHTVSRLSYLFAHLHLLSSDSFSSLIFFLLTLSLLWSSLFYSSLLSDSSHLCFSSVYIVGSLTSKLPSINKKTQSKSENGGTSPKMHQHAISVGSKSVSHRKKDD